MAGVTSPPFPKLLPSLFRFYSSPSELFSLKNRNSIALIERCRNVSDLKPLKSHLILHGLIKDEVFLKKFLNCCFSLGAPELALSTFRTAQNPSLLLQNLMVRCLSDHNLYQDVLSVYAECQASRLCSSDDFTFPSVIKACSILGQFSIGREVHSVVLRTGFEKNVVIQSALVHFYCRNGRVDIARVLLDEMLEPDLISYNALISGYSLNGFDSEALDVFTAIQKMDLNPNLSTFASIVPVCTRLGCLDIGKSVHSFALKSGCLSNDFLVPALISMYAKAADLSSSRILFDSVREKKLASWNSMIYAYTQNRKLYEAFEVFRRMIYTETRPDPVTFVSIIPSCENPLEKDYGESLHAIVVILGIENQPSVLTALLTMYGKLEKISSAEFLFDQMIDKSLLAWNTMISVYVSNSLWDESLVAFRDMQRLDFNPDAVTIVSVLSALLNKGAGSGLVAKSVHSYCIRRGINKNLNASNALLVFYSDIGQLSSSLKLFNTMTSKNTVSWNTLIAGYVHEGEMENAEATFHYMRNEGVEFDVVTLLSILTIYNGVDDVLKGMVIHGYSIKTGFALNIFLANALISMYCNCGDLQSGELLFTTMLEKSVASWNSLITGYRHYKLPNEALLLFRRMVAENQKPNDITLLNLLPACQTLLQGKSIHASILRKGISQGTGLLTSLIFMYSRFENLNSCLSLFQSGKMNDISLWNSIISVNTQTKNPKEALYYFLDFLRTGLKPDSYTILSLISAGVQLNSLHSAHSIMAFVIRNGFDKEVTINNALIDLYAKCGSISVAEKLFNNSAEKDTVTWSMMINAYGIHGLGEAALKLLTKMEISGCKPDCITYSSILSACSHTGLVEQGWFIFSCMIDRGMSPRVEDFACIVDLLGRNGYITEAYSVIEKLPCRPSESLIRSFLGACLIHGEVELGERVSTMYREMSPHDSETYVMRYSIYAAAGRWTDAYRVRSEIENRQLNKVAGFSLLFGDGR